MTKESSHLINVLGVHFKTVIGEYIFAQKILQHSRLFLMGW